MNSTNKMLLTSVSNMVAFGAFERARTLLTQPVLIVAGTDAGSLWQARSFTPGRMGRRS